MTEQCRTYDVDGEPVVVRGSADLTDEEREALADLVRAVRARFDAEEQQ